MKKIDGPPRIATCESESQVAVVSLPALKKLNPMKLSQPKAEIFVPDELPAKEALERTTHMGIGAHPDDLEFLMLHPILECFQNSQKWFCGVTVTNGGSGPRANQYASYTDEQMQVMRRTEQKKAAVIGKYTAAVCLDYPSSAIKVPHCITLIDDLKELIAGASPDVIFTHNLADRHDTHVAVALAVIQALRQLPVTHRPKALYGCEGWRNLDWMLNQDKTVFNVSAGEKLATALANTFDSQISGGKRYDMAAVARKRANATFLEPHVTDQATALEFAMNLTPLIYNLNINIYEYVKVFIRRFEEDVQTRILKFFS